MWFQRVVATHAPDFSAGVWQCPVLRGISPGNLQGKATSEGEESSDALDSPGPAANLNHRLADFQVEKGQREDVMRIMIVRYTSTLLI